MTVSSTTTKTTYSGDGVTVAFATGFKFIANADVKVILRDENVTPVTESTWVENTQYTLTGAGKAAGGTVTAKTAPTDYTPASGEKLIIKRAAAETQGSALPAGGAFPSSTVEDALDRLTMLVQAHSEEIARAVVLSETTPTGSITLPEPTANQLLSWNAGATDLANVAAADVSLTTVSAYINGLLDDADAATARTTLGLGTGDSPQFTGIELGHATDTTLTRSAAGIMQIEGKTVAVLSTAQEYTATQNFNATMLTDGATISWDASANQVASVTLAGNRTMAAPTNLVDGATYILHVIQDGTGSRTLTWNAVFKWPGGTAPTLTTTASARDIVTFVSDGTNLYGVAQLAFS